MINKQINDLIKIYSEKEKETKKKYHLLKGHL